MSIERSINKTTPLPCISIIGMAGAGKSTVSGVLASYLNFALVDTDHCIESTYGTTLQNIANAMTKDIFLDIEATSIMNLQLRRCVIATGGSVVYRENAMNHLAGLGPIIHLKVSLPLVLARIAQKPNRGLAIAPGQTIEDLFYEREDLYQKYAQYTIDADNLNPTECVHQIARFLTKNFPYCLPK